MSRLERRGCRCGRERARGISRRRPQGSHANSGRRREDGGLDALALRSAWRRRPRRRISERSRRDDRASDVRCRRDHAARRRRDRRRESPRLGMADRRRGYPEPFRFDGHSDLARQAPGVTVGNVSGNDFQPDVSYRGFDATPVSGTAQGLAVYQNGVRMNEAFGDTVNWDLIAANAIDRMTLVAGDPIYGLNALGGALNVTMKNGFTWQGLEADGRGGSFGREQASFQFGKQVGDFAGLCRRRGDQRRRLARGRRLADPPRLRRRRLQGERVRDAPQRHRGLEHASALRRRRRSSCCKTTGAASIRFRRRRPISSR